ncbi:DNA-binding IclR family transcriptional regulator [Caballeronia udeis]|jgi:DNA-binding IclR family transcriptional regulator|uniref:DNA-binding IclR family transcriptional regulator n=1 Tax=Caballeronia udeis TaxID=1232866 RepID=A0ABW8MVN9_9BURK
MPRQRIISDVKKVDHTIEVTAVNADIKAADAEGRAYSAPALEKGLDILEMLCQAEAPSSMKDIAQQLGRSVGELYRMLAVLIDRRYVAQVGDSYYITTKLFSLSHDNPPTHKLLAEAMPIMQKLSSQLDQACHLTVYGQGRQIVIAKVDTPSGMGFSVRVGSELDVLVSASGRVLLAFQDLETRKFWIEESLVRRPEQADPQIAGVLDFINKRGYESAPSVQVRGLYAVSYPVLDSHDRAIAALTVPYAERIDQARRKSIVDIEGALGEAAALLCARVGGRSPVSEQA